MPAEGYPNLLHHRESKAVGCRNSMRKSPL
jgi:hypothetical protein